MPYIRDDNGGSDQYVPDKGRVPYDGSYSYQGKRLMKGSLFEDNFEKKKKQPEEDEPKRAKSMSYKEQMHSRIESMRHEIRQAQQGQWKPFGDAIAPKDVRPSNGPLGARQLTPFELQVTSLLGWMQAHRDSGTVHGIPDAQSDFEKSFQADLLQVGSDRGDEFRIRVQLERRDYMEYEQIFADEVAARSGSLAKYSERIPAPAAEAPREKSSTIEREQVRLPPTVTSSGLTIKRIFIAVLILVAVWLIARMGLLGAELQHLAVLPSALLVT